MRLYLIRHGETEFNKEFRFLGRTDIGLSEKGIRQAEALASHLSAEGISSIFCSDMKRARQTAEIIASLHQLEVKPLSALREVDFGRWEGLTYDEIKAIDSDYLEAWIEDPFNVDIPDGEPWASFKARLIGAVTGIINEAKGEHTVLVSHGGPIKLLVSHFKEDEELFKSYWPSPGSLSVIETTGSSSEIVLLNETYYTGE